MKDKLDLNSRPSMPWTRRRVLSAAAGGLAITAGTSPWSPVVGQSNKLTYWGGLIFSEDANKLLVDTINAWGAANGVETEVVMINQNETVQKVSAAVASNTMPDALDLSLDLLLLMSRQGVFITLDDLYAKIGEAQGGWYDGVNRATDTTGIAGGRTGIPFGVSGNLLLRRKDLLEPAGFTEPPKTWQELVDQAVAVNKPPVSGLGLALSNVGDGNVQVSVLQSYGGRIADDAGKMVTIKSEETRTYLTWLKDAWDKGLFPPGAATWDGAGDNQAYLSGQAAFIANTGSVGIAAKKDDPELFEASAFSPLPAGPVRHDLADQPAGPRDHQDQREPGGRQGADRASVESRVHERLFQRRHLRTGAEEPGDTPGFRWLQRDPDWSAWACAEGNGAGLSGCLQRRLCRHVVQLHHPQDGAARRHRRLGFRPGDGRSTGADPGDLRQILKERICRGEANAYISRAAVTRFRISDVAGREGCVARAKAGLRGWETPSSASSLMRWSRRWFC